MRWLKEMRSFFHWKYSGVFIPLWFGTGVAMGLANHFVLAYLFFVVCGLWSVAYWLTSDYLDKQRGMLRGRAIARNPERLQRAKRRYLTALYGISILLVLLTGICLDVVHIAQTEYELSTLEGFLYPANDKDPPSFCAPTDENALKFFMGRNEAYSSQFPFAVLRIHNKNRIVVDRNKDKRIALSMDVFDETGKVLVTFEKGHFIVVQNNILDFGRPDKSTLIVRDQHKNEVLYVHYINPRSVQVAALLRYPDYGTVSISKTSAVTGFCSGDNGGAAIGIE